MSDEDNFSPISDRLSELTGALERSASRLREGQLEPAAAAELVDECARLASEAAAELERVLRSAARTQEPLIGGQGELL